MDLSCLHLRTRSIQLDCSLPLLWLNFERLFSSVVNARTDHYTRELCCWRLDMDRLRSTAARTWSARIAGGIVAEFWNLRRRNFHKSTLIYFVTLLKTANVTAMRIARIPTSSIAPDRTWTVKLPSQPNDVIRSGVVNLKRNLPLVCSSENPMALA